MSDLQSPKTIHNLYKCFLREQLDFKGTNHALSWTGGNFSRTHDPSDAFSLIFDSTLLPDLLLAGGLLLRLFHPAPEEAGATSADLPLRLGVLGPGAARATSSFVGVLEPVEASSCCFRICKTIQSRN